MHVAVLHAAHALRARAVYLAGGVRIPAHVVRREVILPHRQAGKLQHRAAQRANQLRLQHQKQRNGRIADVHGADAAVGIVLLGEQHHLPLAVGDQLVRCDGVAVGRRSDERIILAAAIHAHAMEHPVELRAAIVQRIVGLHFDHGVHQRRAIAGIPRLCRIAEVIDGGHIVIAQQQLSCLARLHMADHLQIILSAAHRLAAGQIQISPVDGDVVAGMAQHVLLAAARIGEVQPIHVECIGQHGRALIAVIADVVIGAERQLHLARRLFHGKAHARHRRGEQIHVLGQHGRLKHHAERRARRLEAEGAARGRHHRSRLLRRRGLTRAQKAVGLAVHANLAVQPLAGTGPVGRVAIGQPIVRAPNREIGIIHHQRHCRQSHHGLHRVFLLNSTE